MRQEQQGLQLMHPYQQISRSSRSHRFRIQSFYDIVDQPDLLLNVASLLFDYGELFLHKLGDILRENLRGFALIDLRD